MFERLIRLDNWARAAGFVTIFGSALVCSLLWALYQTPPGQLESQALCIYKLAEICFVRPVDQNGGIFGFAEFVQAFGLLALVFTVSDVRSRFRLGTSPIPFWPTAFWFSGFIGGGGLPRSSGPVGMLV